MVKDGSKKTIRDFVIKALSKQKLTKIQLVEKIHKEFGGVREQKTTLRYVNMLFNKLRKTGHKLKRVEDRGAVGVYKIIC